MTGNVSKLGTAIFNFWRQIPTYGAMGGIATGVDWGSCYVALHGFHWNGEIAHWSGQIALTVGFTLGSITHYTLNKKITFRNKCERVDTQIVVFIIIALICWALSQGWYALITQILHLISDKFFARVAVTFIMFPITFVLHKLITFNVKVIK